MIEQAIFQALGPLVNNRIFPEVLPQDLAVFPAIRYTFPTNLPISTICGGSDLDDYRVQIDIYAREYDPLIVLRVQVIDAMDAIPHAERISDTTDYESDPKLYRRTIEYGIKSVY